MHNIQAHDGPRRIDWGQTSEDYATFRPGYPPSFFARLQVLGIALPGQHILDLGTGTGVLARMFAALGSRVTGIDIAENQIEAAQQLAKKQEVSAQFFCASAEETGLSDNSFDVVSASQCWLYFDKPRAIREVRRVLKKGGYLLTCHLCWLPRLDEIAQRTEELVLRHNPNWSAANWSGEIPTQPEWSMDDFRVRAMFYYDEALPFTRESWRGRIRACRGVGATLNEEEVAKFDAEHARLLEKTVPEQFTVLHRIDAHILEFKNS